MSRLWPFATLIALAIPSSIGAQSAGDMWGTARPLTLKLSSFKFNPSEIVLEHGVPYDLHLVNTSSGGHDFAAKDFFASAQIMPQDMAKVRSGRVEVGGGESVELRLIAPPQGSYKLRCTHFMHGAFGMKGRIIVR
jgi:uncharacterized cupredoxin-like copper-binding protein